MTFLPVSHLDSYQGETMQTVIKSELTSSNYPNCKDPSTLLELVLENIAGLKDKFPDHEQPDLNTHFFNGKNRSNDYFFQSFILPVNTPEITPVNIASEGLSKNFYAHVLPLLQHHGYIFRLTPF